MSTVKIESEPSELKSRISLGRAMIVARHEFRILFNDPTFLVIMVFMPLVLMTFLNRVFRLSLVSEGYTNATGAEQTVPGITVMFTFFLMGSVAFAFFREHGWGTWDRLRASRARPSEVMLGKVLPVVCLALFQQSLLFGLGMLIFGLRVRGSFVALFLIALAFSFCLVGFGIVLTAITKTANQQNAVSNVGTMVFAGLGGAFAPSSSLPGWARAAGPATPSYWAMKGYRSVILDGAGIFDVGLVVLVLIAFTAVLTAIGLYRFRFEETKIMWA